MDHRALGHALHVLVLLHPGAVPGRSIIMVGLFLDEMKFVYHSADGAPVGVESDRLLAGG